MARGFESEKDLQTAAVRWARARGWFARRGAGAGRRSAPDYMFASRGRCVWVEFKKPGNEPTELQRLEHLEMRSHGLNVVWVDNLDDFKAVLVCLGLNHY